MQPVTIYDATERLKNWGRYGFAGGSIIGTVLGIALAATPFTGKVLTFGVAGTLTICIAELALCGAALGMLTAALQHPSVAMTSRSCTTLRS